MLFLTQRIAQITRREGPLGIYAAGAIDGGNAQSRGLLDIYSLDRSKKVVSL